MSQETGVVTNEYGNLVEQHVYHHSANEGPRVNVKVEKNSKGYNFEATVLGAETPELALELLRQTVARLEAEYGSKAA